MAKPHYKKLSLFLVAVSFSGLAFASVTVIGSGDKKETQYCKQIDSDRDYVRSQQRQRSTQELRDEYNRLSKIWQKECLNN